MSLDLFHDVDAVAKITLRPCVLIDVSLAAHLLCYLFHLLDVVADMDATFHSILLEVALCSTGYLDLGFHHKLLAVFGSELSCDRVSFFAIESDVSSRDRHSVAVEDLRGMVLV